MLQEEQYAVHCDINLSGSDLVWQERNWRRQAFDLYAGNDVIATVAWKNWQQTKVIAQIGNKRWRFERQRSWRSGDIVSALPVLKPNPHP